MSKFQPITLIEKITKHLIELKNPNGSIRIWIRRKRLGSTRRNNFMKCLKLANKDNLRFLIRDMEHYDLYSFAKELEKRDYLKSYQIEIQGIKSDYIEFGLLPKAINIVSSNKMLLIAKLTFGISIFAVLVSIIAILHK